MGNAVYCTRLRELQSPFVRTMTENFRIGSDHECRCGTSQSPSDGRGGRCTGKPQGFITGSMATVHSPPKLPRDLDRQRTGNSTTPFVPQGRATR